MEMTIMPTVLATTIYLSSLLSGTPAVSQTKQVDFTRVLPDNNVTMYAVKPGDSLKSIARAYYMDEEYWTMLWNDNPTITNPDELTDYSRIRVRVHKPSQPEKLLAVLEQNSPAQKTALAEATKSDTVLPTVTVTPMPTTVVPSTAPAAPTTSGADNGAPSSYDAVYKEAAAKYGVSWQVLYGLHITETGGRDGMVMNGSGSGARGPMQFMPGTWNAYGADGDGDGVANIDSAVDAIHGAANYLAKHGSLESGLRSYGGNTAGVMKLARERGFNN